MNDAALLTVQLENVEPLATTRFIGPGSAVQIVSGKYKGREGVVRQTLPMFMLTIREGWL